MPELPEVEVTRRGLASRLTGRRVRACLLRSPRLRYPIPPDLPTRLEGRQLIEVERRGKYLLLRFDNGHLLVHLGMSGSLRLIGAGQPADRHDHVDLDFEGEFLRLRDPRRFGALLWLDDDPQRHPLLAHLGMEPLERGFTAERLATALTNRHTAIKPALMNGDIVVGVGNIYASESLFHAGIDPRLMAARISPERLAQLVPAIKETLRAAIRAGGSSVRDYVGSDGGLGGFQFRHRVYGRAGQPCLRCGTPIDYLRQANRATFFCPNCQR